MDLQSINLLLIGKNIQDEWLLHFNSCLERFAKTALASKSQALAQVEINKFDVIIIDEMILLADFNFIHKILEITPSARVLVVSDMTDDWIRTRRAFYHGAIDYQPKTISSQDLKRIIQDIYNP